MEKTLSTLWKRLETLYATKSPFSVETAPIYVSHERL
ncbi:hypothetical protein Gotur_008647 [Gossypium turneri]